MNEEKFTKMTIEVEMRKDHRFLYIRNAEGKVQIWCRLAK